MIKLTKCTSGVKSLRLEVNISDIKPTDFKDKFTFFFDTWIGKIWFLLVKNRDNIFCIKYYHRKSMKPELIELGIDFKKTIEKLTELIDTKELQNKLFTS